MYACTQQRQRGLSEQMTSRSAFFLVSSVCDMHNESTSGTYAIKGEQRPRAKQAVPSQFQLVHGVHYIEHQANWPLTLWRRATVTVFHQELDGRTAGNVRDPQVQVLLLPHLKEEALCAVLHLTDLKDWLKLNLPIEIGIGLITGATSLREWDFYGSRYKRVHFWNGSHLIDDGELVLSIQLCICSQRFVYMTTFTLSSFIHYINHWTRPHKKMLHGSLFSPGSGGWVHCRGGG